MPMWTASDDPLTLADMLDLQRIKANDYTALFRFLRRRLRPIPTEEELGSLPMPEVERLVTEVITPALQRSIDATMAVRRMVAAVKSDPESS